MMSGHGEGCRRSLKPQMTQRRHQLHTLRSEECIQIHRTEPLTLFCNETVKDTV